MRVPQRRASDALKRTCRAEPWKQRRRSSLGVGVGELDGLCDGEWRLDILSIILCIIASRAASATSFSWFCSMKRVRAVFCCCVERSMALRRGMVLEDMMMVEVVMLCLVCFGFETCSLAAPVVAHLGKLGIGLL